jgi:hypothetical protein
MVSRKGDYSGKLGSVDLEGEVKRLMASQHKTMLKGLQAGEFDPVILQRIGPEAFKERTDSVDTMSELEAPRAAPAQPLHEAVEAAPGSVQERLNRAFGEGVVSEKPLDEVVLEYLVENARKRKRRSR